MKIIVIGYGRLGTQFVRKIDRPEHRVVVIDTDRMALEGRARPEGETLVYGNTIDEDLLRDSGAGLLKAELTGAAVISIVPSGALFPIPPGSARADIRERQAHTGRKNGTPFTRTG